MNGHPSDTGELGDTVHDNPPRLSSGIAGLDTVLGGGYLAGYHYLVRGTPGAGKTMLGWHFLTAEGGDDALYVTFEESPAKVRRNADSLGIDLSPVHILDLTPEARRQRNEGSYDVFTPSTVEYDSLTARLREEVNDAQPRRVLLDPITQFRYLSPDEFQFRRECLSLLGLLTSEGATVLFTSQTSDEIPDDDLQFLSDGIIELSRPNGGRVLDVPKFRGSDSAVGSHTVRIGPGGMTVFPRVLMEQRTDGFSTDTASSGEPVLDELLHGGVERQTTTLFSGPTGVGKTTIGALFLVAAAERDEHATLYHLEEKPETFVQRCEALGLPVESLYESGRLDVVDVTPSLSTVGEFVAQVLDDVTDETTFVMIDGIQGFLKLTNASDDLDELAALRSQLVNRGVSVILTDEMPNVTGDFQPTKSGETAIADNIVFMRYIEFGGEIHRAIGVLKKRASDFEQQLREFEFTSDGIRVGDPLREFSGILTGTPRRLDRSNPGEEVL